MTIEQELHALHNKAWWVGFAHYLRKGCVLPVVAEVMVATKSLEAFKQHVMAGAKYSPDQPRVPAGNPDGGQWTNGGGEGIDDLPIVPVYPLETALSFLFGGLALVNAGRVLGAGLAATADAAETVALENRWQRLVFEDGDLIGEAGSRSPIRELSGGQEAAEDLFQQLTKGGADVTPPDYKGTSYSMGDGSRIGYRPVSESGEPTIDINIPSIGNILKKLKFLE